MIGSLCGTEIEMCRRVYNSSGIAPTINTMQGGNTEPKILTEK